MKQHYFVKFDRRVNQIIGCQRATLILTTLEYWFSKKQEGFYKFIEPCSHPLYKKEDSWTEELNCDSKSFTNSFKKIGVKYKSRTAFEKAEDKFQGKMYASFYDRYSNRVFFLRNDEEVNKFFARIHSPIKTDEPLVGNKEKSQSLPETNSLNNLLRNGKNSRSNKESKNSSLDLSKDKSHAEEIIKKMIEIWTALVEEGRGKVTLGRTTVPFLKKAFTDKFDSCLEKWRKFCYDIASSRFLMGEKNSFKAKLDWALLFKNIEKVLDGQYGIGDRTPKAILVSQASLQEEILSSEESKEIKDFRSLCLQSVGNAKYISYFKNLSVEFRGEGEVALIAPHTFAADNLERNCYSYLRLILQEFGENTNEIIILAPGEIKGRLIERKGGVKNPAPILSPVSRVAQHTIQEEHSRQELVQQDKHIPGISSETQALLTKLKNTIPPRQFPGWLEKIEVEGISQDGEVVVTLEDSLTVGWCQSRFNQEILQSATSLWKGVDRVVIRQKVGAAIPVSIENLSKKSESIEEKLTLEQALQSLLSVCSPNKPAEPWGTQEACRAFG